jgi:hypothetical protein
MISVGNDHYGRWVIWVDVHPFWKKLEGFKIELSQYLPKNGIGLWRKD